MNDAVILAMGHEDVGALLQENLEGAQLVARRRLEKFLGRGVGEARPA